MVNDTVSGVYCIPYLNIAFVMLTAHSAEWMLEFVGLGSYSMGEVMVDLHDGGEVPLVIGMEV